MGCRCLFQWCKSSCVFILESFENWRKVDFRLAHESSLHLHIDVVLSPEDFSITSNEESLSETEEKNQKVKVSCAPVHSERSNLEDRVRELEELLCEAHRVCERKTKLLVDMQGRISSVTSCHV